MQEPKM